MEELQTKQTAIIDKELKDYTNKIKKCGDNIRKNYLKIAHLLTEVDSKECYLEDGFESTQDYASQILGIQKTTAYNMLRIGYDYISENGERTILTEKGNDYTVSQLQALLPLGVSKVKEINEEGIITPELSVRQIKNIVKEYTDTPKTEEQDPDTIDGEVVKESEEVVKILGSVDFLEDGSLITHGDLSEEFIKEIEKLYDFLYDYQNENN